MKRYLSLVVILFTVSFFAQQIYSMSYKHLMVDAINRGDYNTASRYLNLVKNWDFDPDVEGDWLDVQNALTFVDYISDWYFLKKYLTYIALECDELVDLYYNEGEYEQAIPYAGISVEISKIVFGEKHPDYAASLNNLGLLYAEMGDNAKAEPYVLEFLRITKIVHGETHPDYAPTLNMLGFLYAEMGDNAKAESCFLESLRITKTVHGETHPDYATTLNILVFLYAEMGEYSKAESCCLEVLQITKIVHGEVHPDYASYLEDLAYVYVAMGDNVKAEPYYLEVLRIRKEVQDENHPDYAASLNNLGLLYVEMGDYSKAESYYLESLRIRKEVLDENHPDYATSLGNLGNLYCYMGEYSKAESYSLEALRIRKEVLDENHPDYAASLNNLGLLYAEMGEYSKAESYYLEALRILKSVPDENHPDYALSLANLGALYVKMGEYSKAESYYLESLRIRKEVLDENHPDYAMPLNNLGALYAKMGEYSKAESYYLETLRILKSVLDENHPDYAMTVNNLGVLYAEMGEYSKAESYSLEALRILKSVLDKNHPDYALFLANLGLLYVEMGNYSKAEPYFSESFSIDKNRFLNANAFMTEQQREKYWATMQGNFTIDYPYYTYRYYNEQKSISTSAYNNELFVKGLLLNSSESVKRSILESNDTILIDLWNKLTTKRQEIQVLQEKDFQSDDLAQLQVEAEQLEKQLTVSSADYRESQTMWQITWDSVRNHLSPDEVAIEYFSAPLSRDSVMYCALLVRHDSELPELIPLFEEKEVSAFISSSEGNVTNETYDFHADGDAVSEIVWSKVLPEIKERETIYFAPSGLLHQLAIEYLPYDETRTMADVYNMVRLSSTREIVKNKPQAQYSTATVYGGIQYDMSAEGLLVESEMYSNMTLLASRSLENDTINRGAVRYLPGTKQEAEHIDALLKGNNILAQLYTATKANEESFKALSGKHNNIIHIGTHGFTWTDSVAKKQDYFAEQMRTLDGMKRHRGSVIDPLSRCGLLFAGANIALAGYSNKLPEGVQDGVLTAKEISLIDLRDADLVVLSACETAKGDVTSEGVFGLQRAFKMAGVQTIIMSLWKVDDHATQILMTEFYNNWVGKKQSKREAFRNAQNAVRYAKDANGEYLYSKPVYWAGFVMLD